MSNVSLAGRDIVSKFTVGVKPVVLKVQCTFFLISLEAIAVMHSYCKSYISNKTANCKIFPIITYLDFRFKILYWVVSNSWYAQGAKALNGTIISQRQIKVRILIEQ